MNQTEVIVNGIGIIDGMIKSIGRGWELRETLEAVREDIKAAGFTVRIPRYESDDPVIVEALM